MTRNPGSTGWGGAFFGGNALEKPGAADKKSVEAQNRKSKSKRARTAAYRPRVRMRQYLVDAMERGDLSDWDEEELRRGQKRAHDGTFRGRPPRVVPKMLHDELTRRTLKDAKQVMQDNIVAAASALKDIALDEDMPPSDRVRAIDMMMNRILGKPPERVEVSDHRNPYEELIEGVKRDIDPDEDVIDVESEEMDDEDDEELEDDDDEEE